MAGGLQEVAEECRLRARLRPQTQETQRHDLGIFGSEHVDDVPNGTRLAVPRMSEQHRSGHAVSDALAYTLVELIDRWRGNDIVFANDRMLLERACSSYSQIHFVPRSDERLIWSLHRLRAPTPHRATESMQVVLKTRSPS